jgi:hypothetical protein
MNLCCKGRGRQKYPKNNKRRKNNWIVHILRWNCLVKHLIEGNRRNDINDRKTRKIKRKQILDDLKEKRG